MSELTRRALRNRPAGIARHGRLRKSNPWLRAAGWLASALVVALVSGGAVAGTELWRLQSSIKTVDLGKTIDGEEREELPPTLGEIEGGFNILIVGSDAREGHDAMLNDVTMLLHVAQDQSHAVAVSFPRDMVIPIPSCPKPDGGSYSSMSAQPLNVTLMYGGLPCTVLTVESLTGLEIQFAGMVTFEGVARLSSAVGGVPVCVNGPINDRLSGLHIPEAGTYELEGWEALAFLRTRYGVGDGSDLGRISSQQVYLSSLVRTLKSEGVLGDFGKLYNIANVAVQNMTLSENLKNPQTMISMALALKNLPLERVMFVQYPTVTGGTGIYANKAQPVPHLADALFTKIRADEAFTVEADKTGRGSVKDPNAPVDAAPGTEAPADPSAPSADVPVLEGILGQSAADHTCSKANN